MKWTDVAKVAVKTALASAAIAYLAYDSLWGLLTALPLFPLFYVIKGRRSEDEKKWQMNLGFGEALLAMSAALETGYSVENALTEAYNDMRSSHRESEPIMKELRVISSKIRLGVPAEEAFYSFGERSGLSDVKSFADVFATAKRTGGNVIEIIRSTSEMIHARIDLDRDLRAAVASKRYESDIMKVLPVFMVAYLKLSSPELINGLYGNTRGALFVTFLMGVYAAMCFLSAKIVRIEL